MSASRVDAHQHFWRYQAAEYAWIDDSMRALRRDFLPEDLEREMSAAGVAGAVSVQARQSLAETEWLLELASERAFLRGVVGWAPLTHPRAPDVIAPLAANPKLRALRHLLQDEPDANYILRDDFNRGVGALRQFDLAYDILIYERQLPQTIRFVDRHPNQVFILDHIAKPRIRERAISPWRENLLELARRGHVYCKLSGMATEADREAWTEADLDPYFDAALEAFGPARLMFGSDWPVCRTATSYSAWFRFVSRKIAGLSGAERDRILGGTAIEAYRL